MVRTRLKLAATLTVVVLALTGFHTGHGSSGGSGGGSGKSKSRGGDSDGGGCSNSKKSNDDYDGSGGSGGSSATDEYTYDPTPSSTPTATVYVTTVDCVKPAQKKRKGKPARKADTTTTLKIVSEAWEEKTFRVVVHFEGADHTVVDRTETTVTVERRGTKRFEVEMPHPGTVGRVKQCVAYVDGEVAETATATPTATPTPSATSS
ncbi:hypothetical protein ACFV14_36585 [Streptomyces zaomyceticus]|uniref:hypothetical protein n=1 Tax=Streptomyces zaomyceticus TaxID=68286 RepID=UPI0036B00F44